MPKCGGMVFPEHPWPRPIAKDAGHPAIVGRNPVVDEAIQAMQQARKEIESLRWEAARAKSENMRLSYAWKRGQAKLDQILAVANRASSEKGLDLHETLDRIITIGERPFVVRSCESCDWPLEGEETHCPSCGDRVPTLAELRPEERELRRMAR